MIGNPDSGGVWAPCLSYAEGTLYLIYTDVKSHLGTFRDNHNYLVTAKDIMGPWSDPVYLNSSGFDPSLFHDHDGRKWLVNMLRDHRIGKNPFAGIVIQEFDPTAKCLVGPVHHIFQGTKLGYTEGPHLYRRGEYYYLMVAEGGTRSGHAVMVSRSNSLLGPYEVDPDGPMLTSAGKPELVLQRSGHASLVETHTGDWYIAHLCGRPLRPSMCCNLGRETALQAVRWTEASWLRLADGGNSPVVEVEAGQLPHHPFEKEPETEHFDSEEISIHFAALREPMSDDWVSTTARPGFLRLRGRESINSVHHQSLVARRQQAFVVEGETAVEFQPESFQQLAGLVYYYNTKNYYYLWISRDEDLGKCLGVMASNHGIHEEVLDAPISVEGLNRLYLKAKLVYEDLQFYFSADGLQWIPIGGVLDATIISDENVERVVAGRQMDQGFTGAFLGICVQDLLRQTNYADFDYFTYREL